MRYKVGDRVRIQPLEWYQKEIESEKYYLNIFDIYWCSREMTISKIEKSYYLMEEDMQEFYWTDEMIEGLVEEEVDLIPKFGEFSDNEPLDIPTMTTDFIKEYGLPCPNGYIFKDESGNVINATKIVLEKKKKEYPKTYEECCVALEYIPHTDDIIGYKWDILQSLQRLLICRDAYWKLYGEEMGLGKPWKPRWNDGYQKKYCIYNGRDDIQEDVWLFANFILAFPTEEMRDAFYENFKELINECKELL